MTSNMEWDVRDVFDECTFMRGEEGSNIPVKGTTANFVFSLERINSNYEKIKSLINQLFPKDLFNGIAIAERKLCYTEDGSQWTDSTQACGMLIGLGIAGSLLSIVPQSGHRYSNSSLPGPFVIGVPSRKSAMKQSVTSNT